MEPTRICITPGCSRAQRARNRCSPCYQRARRAGEFQASSLGPLHSLAEVDTDARTAVCAICGPVSIRVRSSGRGHECMTVRERNRGGRSRNWRVTKRQRLYGLGSDEFAQMWLDQDGLCAVCLSSDDLNVDHSHETGKVRGLLCRACNLALGFLDDDVARMERAIAYLGK